jgi:hypothetical protein
MPHLRTRPAPLASPRLHNFKQPAGDRSAAPWPTARRRARALVAALSLLALLGLNDAHAQRKRRPPSGGRAAVVVDERLAALRDAPGLSANLVRRLGRGSLVALTGARGTKDGVTFFRVVVTRRTTGWLQSEAFASPARAGDDARLLRLAGASEGFDRLARARIFLEHFPRSPLRPAALLLFGDAARSAAERLTREAGRRLRDAEMEAGGAAVESYYLNYVGLDRFRRRGVVFTFDAATRQYRYDGAAWREVLRRHPRSPEAGQARLRLSALAAAPR